MHYFDIMDLFLFPESAVETNGYGIVVNSDYDMLSVDPVDQIVWYTKDVTGNSKYKKGDHIIKRNNPLSVRYIFNMLRGRAVSEVKVSELDFLKKENIDEIFCGDVLFYRAIRKMYPEKPITVRFHNNFSRILHRKKQLKIALDPKFMINLRSFDRLERKIFQDKNVRKIFISKEDKDYYERVTGYSDGEIWGIDVDIANAPRDKEAVFDRKLVWFGGVQSHKIKSMEWFIDSVLPEIKKEIPDVEFHLWGDNTKRFNYPSNGIFGHGFYTGVNFPLQGKSLYVNPDIIGGGVKIKLKTYLENGIPHITTPYGFEGYDVSLADGRYCIVEEPEKWSETIVQLLNENCLIQRQQSLIL